MQLRLDLRTAVVGAWIVIFLMIFGLLNPRSGQARAQSGAAAPQAETAASQSFEVASIKPSAGDPRMVGIQISPGGRFTASGVTAKLLIQQAYGIQDYQISGGPGWISSERYDIVAKAETPNLTRDMLKVLIQSLLAERFKLQMHRETKELPIYSLVIAKNGHKMHLSEVQPPANGDTPTNAVKPGESPLGAAAGRGTPKGAMIRMGRGQLNAQMAPISALCNMLSQQLGRPVLDKTDLKGNFDFNLEWTPDETQRGPGFAGLEKPAAETAAPGESSGPSIYTALQEQLGLKLDSQKGPVEILVIDRIDKPTQN